ncbi:MAG: hypothetical protein ACI91B_003948 [Planctomycetota bacterium]|jgi:hypothetical protein
MQSGQCDPGHAPTSEDFASRQQRSKVVTNAINYFRLHRTRMCYPDFVAMGLPIGSGNVESAAKNIVQARLKRSCMRWSRHGE